MLFDKIFIITQLESGRVNKGGRNAKTPINPNYLIMPNQYWIFGAYSEGPMISTIKESWTELQSWPVKRESVVNRKLSREYQNISY